jgi:cell division protein FtsB
MLFRQRITSKAAILALIVLLVFLGDLKFRQWQSQREIERQEASLQAQADALQKKNNELNRSLEYLNSPSFKERVAREQLGYKRQGETAYGFSDASGSASAGQANGAPGNLQKWWDYFFTE